MKSVSHSIEWLLVISMKSHRNKSIKFVTKPRVWELKDEDTDRLFIHEIALRTDDFNKADDVRKR